MMEDLNTLDVVIIGSKLLIHHRRKARAKLWYLVYSSQGVLEWIVPHKIDHK